VFGQLILAVGRDGRAASSDEVLLGEMGSTMSDPRLFEGSKRRWRGRSGTSESAIEGSDPAAGERSTADAFGSWDRAYPHESAPHFGHRSVDLDLAKPQSRSSVAGRVACKVSTTCTQPLAVRLTATGPPNPASGRSSNGSRRLKKHQAKRITLTSAVHETMHKAMNATSNGLLLRRVGRDRS